MGAVLICQLFNDPREGSWFKGDGQDQPVAEADPAPFR
jgi:hypothetical protein